MLSSLIQRLSEIFEHFPGVGPKTAERFAFHLFKQPPENLNNFIQTIIEIKDNIKKCSLCQNFSLNDPCEICADPRRDQNLICVVALPQDLLALEKTGEYRGVYHLLGGNLDLPEGLTPEKLKIKELVERIKKGLTKSKNMEVILGLNANLEGETTSLFLARILKSPGIKITRLARGLPQGSDLQYADEVTLTNALKERKEI